MIAVKHYYLLIGLVPLITFCTPPSEYPETFSQPYFDMVDDEFSDKTAFATVDYVEDFFRVVGNDGFNNSIYYVEDQLMKAGFVEESEANADDRLTYRIEHRPLDHPSWQPVHGSLKLGSGEELVNFPDNRNMITINSFSTDGEQKLEVVDVGSGRDLNFDEDVTGKVVYAETSIGYLYREAVINRGAVGVIAYRMPSYTRPEVNQTSIQFSGIPYKEEKKSWGILLSYDAKTQLEEALAAGEHTIIVDLTTEFVASDELTIVAELKGEMYPEERFVFSAHVQEPGANDNASGVGALTEIARTSARLFQTGKINPERTITYLFGDEIISTRRYIQEDSVRAKSIKWGMSLDMVGEDTEKTGGTFLIEKMPDPGAIYLRGDEQHTEWGGRPLKKADLVPHYFNDFVLNRFKEQGITKNWMVKTNPFEGGSDHVPFLRGDIPGLLLWHFTDQFYHTSNDRIDKVSETTLKNVGTGALVTALILTSDQQRIAPLILQETKESAIKRLNAEFELSRQALLDSSDVETEREIIATWTEFYMESLENTSDLLSNPSLAFKLKIEAAVDEVRSEGNRLEELLK